MAAPEKAAKARGGKGADVPQAVTANRLGDGIVVFLADADRWAERAADARIARDKASADALMAIAEADVVRRVVVAPYLIEMSETASGPEPASLRERIRAQGPTVRLDLGKQAEKDASHVSL